jgi:membrane-associated protease RseP (regulator of RpoE activity)
MRAARLLCLTLIGLVAAVAPAHAEKSESPPSGEIVKRKTARKGLPPYRLIRILPETHQALLLDKKRDKHVLVDVGESVGGYEVIEIDVDHVVLARVGDAREFVLVAGEATPTTRLADPYPIPSPAPSDPASPLLDPYPAGVLDPYGSEGVREVQAPPSQRAEPTPDPAEASAITDPPSADPPKADPPKADPPKADPPKADPPKADPPKADPPPVTSFTLSRARLDAALGDFAAIAREADLALTDGGVSVKRLAPESFLHEVGLREGDRVTKVDGVAIKSLDDAASVYARLRKAKTFKVEIVRAGAPLTLTYKIAAR